MASHAAANIPDYIDDTTKDIVSGYIRELQQLITSFNGNIGGFSDEISQMTLIYVDDHFMHYRGSYEWCITDPITINNILSSQQTQRFTSDIFEIAKLKWMVSMYPNGNTAAANTLNQFVIFIHLLSMPSSWNQVMICQTIKVHELDTEFSEVHVYNKLRTGNMKKWPLDTLSFNELINQQPILNRLTITVQLKIIRIIVTEKYKKVVKYQSAVNKYQSHYKLRWDLNPQRLCRLHTHFLPKKPISSRIIGDLFNVYYIPSQNKFKLQLLGLPDREMIEGLQVKWSLSTAEMPEIKYSTISQLSFKSHSTTYSTSELLIPSLTMDTFREMRYCTFLLDIEILNEYDNNGMMIGGVSAEDEWNKIITDTQKQQKHVEKQRKSSKKTRKVAMRISAAARGTAVKGIVGIDDEGGEDDERWKKVQEQKKEELKRWLYDEVQLPQYYDLLTKNGYDNMDAVTTMKASHLKLMGMGKVGHRQQILKYVAKWVESRALEEKNKKKVKEETNTMRTVIVFGAVLAGILVVGSWSGKSG